MDFGGGVSQTVLNPFVLLVVILAGLLILFLPRNKAFMPFLVAALLIPIDQVLLIGSLHFPTLRILILFGAIRILFVKLSGKGKTFSGGMNAIDWAVVLLALFTAINGILLWREAGAIVFQLGNMYNALGIYLVLRMLICDEDDVRRVIQTLAVVAVFVGAIMISEQLTGHNPYYAMLGGARAGEYGKALEIRDGKLRATGVFAHPILAGTFGDFLFPLFVGLFWRAQKGDRKFAVLGGIAAVIMPFAANSSTALLALIGGLIGLAFWPLRRRMRIIRWGIALTIVSLHLVMHGPVWALIARMDLSGSSSSDHRYRLVNECIHHFSDWWLIGTKAYPDWGWSMWDLSDTYVAIADTAGLIPLMCLIAILVFCFRYTGLARRAAEIAGDHRQEKFMWAIGASLFANVVAFFGIWYFDQTFVAWYAVVAMVSAASLAARSQLEAQLPAVVNAIPSPANELPYQLTSTSPGSFGSR